MNATIRIAIAEDHQLLRNTLTTVLNAEDDFEVVLSTGNGAELLDGMKHKQIDIVLLDLNMPIMDGRDALPYLLEHFPTTGILIVSMYFGGEYIDKYMRLGAHGYLSKDCAPEHLREAIRSIYYDGFFVHEMTPVPLIAELIRKGNIDLPLAKDPVTGRERDIVKLICEKKSDEEIAKELGMQTEDVKDHLHRIMEKIGARNHTGIIVYAITNGLFTVEE